MLEEYRRKRARAPTNEPAGLARRDPAGPTQAGRFVVHQHDATRMHWDLRLEVGGALASFAVPRGPSLDPADRRLAIRTEDHPVEYLDFEAMIPEGAYGAGSMIVWDQGLVRYLGGTAQDGLEAGKLDFELRGFKLRGRFSLHETKQKDGEDAHWLLFKKADDFAAAGRSITETEPRSVLSGLGVDELPDAALMAAAVEARAAAAGAQRRVVDPRSLTPMTCAMHDDGSLAWTHDPRWLFELKLDGVRILADKAGPSVHLYYRKSRPATTSYPEIARALRALPFESVLLDGEIVAFDDKGRPSFQLLARRVQGSRANASALALDPPVVYVVFDVLAVGDRDLRSLPLEKRKALLFEVVRGKGVLRALDHLDGDAEPLLELCRRERLEGIVAKRKASAYTAGPRRTGDWVKVKRERDDELVVVGFTRGERGRDRLGALDLASYEGDALVLRGKVGSGLSGRAIDELLPRLAALEARECAARGKLERSPRGRTFVRPGIVVSVRYAGWSDGGRLRHPVFRGVREDVSPSECRVAPPAALEPVAVTGASIDSPSIGEPPEPAHGPFRVKLTNRNKMFWPQEGYTKGDLLDYYASVGDVLLPHLHDRPIVLVRHPDGIDGKSFYQWNVPRHAPSWIQTLALPFEHQDGRVIRAFLVDDLDALLYVVNLGAIPIHVFSFRAAIPDSCDFLTVDLDLGAAPLRSAVTLALSLHAMLRDVGLTGFPKTSGQTGLHVLVPLGHGTSFETARALAELFARLLVSRHPALATLERMPGKRGDRVYVDVGQTGKARTIVGPYSVRAHAGATVSTPLGWDEVSPALDPSLFTIRTVPPRARALGDPMAALLATDADVAASVERLHRLIGDGF